MEKTNWTLANYRCKTAFSFLGPLGVQKRNLPHFKGLISANCNPRAQGHEQGGSHVFETGRAPAFSGTFRNKNCPCPCRSLHLSGPKTARARARGAHKVTPPLMKALLPSATSFWKRLFYTYKGLAFSLFFPRLYAMVFDVKIIKRFFKSQFFSVWCPSRCAVWSGFFAPHYLSGTT